MKKIQSVDKYKGKTFCVELDGGEVQYLNEEIILQYHLAEGAEVPDSAWEDILYSDKLRKARERALYLLDYRDYSYTELFRKLERSYPDEVCFETMGRLVELGMINDRRYAQNIARRLCGIKGYGCYRAAQEMRLKGLDRELVDSALEPYAEGSVERIKELVSEKYASGITDRSSYEKMKRSLVRRGYSCCQIKQALEELEIEPPDA